MEEVPSPCVAICQIDDNGYYCIGCYRTVEEIEHWSQFDNETKLQVIAAIQARRDGQLISD